MVVADRATRAPTGFEVIDQRYVSGLPSTSVEPAPVNCTRAPTVTVWFGPALATGGELSVEMDIVSGLLSSRPSLTMSWRVYVPNLSAMNVGLTMAGAERTALLPAGLAVNNQLYVRGFPSISVEPLPFSWTVWVT